jgi:hypothetical protein
VAGELRWSQRFGAPGIDVARTIATGGGAIAVAGSFEGTVAMGDEELTAVGGRDAFVALVNPEGLVLWTKGIGGPGDDEIASISVDLSGSVLVTGSFTGTIDLGSGPLTASGADDVLVARFFRTGVVQWAQQLGGENDTVHAAAVSFDVACNAYIAGSFEGTFDVGRQPLVSAGASDAFLIKLDPDGKYQWSVGLGDVGDDRAEAVSVGIVAPLIGGTWGGDAFVTTLDATGMVQWSHVYAGSHGSVTAVAADLGGGSYIAGHMSGAAAIGDEMLESAGGKDMFVAALGYDGMPRWVKRFGDAADQAALGLAHEAGVVAVAGAFDGDLFALRLTPEGEEVWSHVWGDRAMQFGSAIDVGDQLGVVVAGAFEGSIDVGAELLVSAGASDALLLSVEP